MDPRTATVALTVAGVTRELPISYYDTDTCTSTERVFTGYIKRGGATFGISTRLWRLDRMPQVQADNYRRRSTLVTDSRGVVWAWSQMGYIRNNFGTACDWSDITPPTHTSTNRRIAR